MGGRPRTQLVLVCGVSRQDVRRSGDLLRGPGAVLVEHDLRRLAEGVVERRVTGPDGLDGAWTALELAHGCTTRLSAPGSELLTDTIDRAMLLSPRLQPMRDRLAEAGSPWRFGADRPEDELFLPRDWSAEVSLYSDVGTRLGRWPGPAHPRGTAGAPQSYLIRAQR